MMERYSKVENVRLASMVSQLKTSVRNGLSQAARYGMNTVEDAVDGVLKAASGVPISEAMSRPVEDIFSLFRMMTPSGYEKVDKILSMLPPEQKIKLFKSPILDVTLGTKYARFLTTINRAQEYFFRRMGLDATIRGELAAKGYDVPGDPAKWNIPKEEIAAAGEKAVQKGLELTFAETPAPGTLARSILTAYREFPILRLAFPFPRFAFGNALKFVYNYSPAALLYPPKVKEISDAVGKGDFRPLTRATMGTLALVWAYTYRNQPDAPGEWFNVRVGDNKQVDVRPFAPFSAYLFLAEAIRDAERYAKGIPARLDFQDYLSAAVGMNRIAGTGLSIVDAVMAKQRSPEARWRQIKEVAGDYAASFFIPLQQVKDIVAQVSPEEAIRRDIRGRELTGPVISAIPGLSRTLPPLPAITRPGPAKQENPLMTQFTGLYFKQPTDVEKELSRVGVNFRDMVPVSSGNPDVDRRAAAIAGDFIEKRMSKIMATQTYKKADDPGRQDMLLKSLGAVKDFASRKAEAEYRLRPAKRQEKLRGAPRLIPYGERYPQRELPNFVPSVIPR